MKPKVHRFRSDCQHAMLEEIQKRIASAIPRCSEEDYDYSSHRPRVIGMIYEYMIQGVEVEVRLRFPDNCTVCGCDARRLDMKYGRNW